MSDYSCETCHMSVKELQCGKCGQKLVLQHIEKNGAKIQVAVCPNGCGKIKSPQCCGQDMKKAH